MNPSRWLYTIPLRLRSLFRAQAAVLAAYWPARRDTRVNPTLALRYE